jgi:tetratricopeptide (TPR) repeat protein
MMGKPLHPIALMAPFALMVPLLAASAQDKPQAADEVGLISQVKGACWLQRGNSREQITPSKHGGARLRVGDKVRCDKGGRLVLELRSMRTTVEPSAPDQWTTIPAASGLRKDAMAGPVDDWFKLAGGLRKPPVGVYSPPGGGNVGAIWPEHFVIRWVPGKGDVSLCIRGENGDQLWPQGKDGGLVVPSASGELDAKELRQALSDYRKSGQTGVLTLIVIDSQGREGDVQFSVVSSEDTKRLKRQLKQCSKQPGLMQYICRAYCFRQLKLYTEAVEEYDIALRNLAPDSVDLQLHAIVAHRLIGNYAREQELVRRLPPGTEVPE